MLSSILGSGVRQKHAEEVVGARRGAEQQEEPSRLQVGNGRDALQQSVVLAALLLQVLSHKSCGSEGRQERPVPRVPAASSTPLPKHRHAIGAGWRGDWGAPLPQRSRRGSCPD